MIHVSNGERVFMLRWNGRDYRDQAGHLWTVNNMRLISDKHGVFFDWTADVWPSSPNSHFKGGER